MYRELRTQISFVTVLLVAIGSATADDSSILSTLPADGQAVLLVGDPLPHLKALLHDDKLREVIEHGSLGKLLRSAPQRPTNLDPALIWDMIEPQQQWIPREMAIAVPSGWERSLDQLVRAGIFVGLSQAIIDGDHAGKSRQYTELQEQLVVACKQFKIPRITIYARFREPETADQLFGSLRILASQINESELKFKLTVEGTAIGINAVLGDLVEPEMIDATLLGLGVGADAEQTQLQELRETIAALRFEAWLESVDRGLRLSVGPRPDATSPGLTSKNLGPVFRFSSKDLLFARWQIEEFKKIIDGWSRLWAKWETTAAGQKLAEWDDEDLIGDLSQLQRQIKRSAASGSLRAWTDNSSLEGILREEGAAEAVVLTGSPLARKLPSNFECLWVTGTKSLGDCAADYLSRFEDRLATKSLQYDLSGKVQQAQMAERIGRAYYDHFDKFRKLVHNEAPNAFQAPMAMLVSSDGNVRKFRAGSVVNGKRQELELKDLRVMEVAAIGRCENEEKALKLIGDLAESFVAGALKTAEVNAPEKLNLVRKVDLGLKATTYEFDTSWVNYISGEEKLDWRIEGDLRLHFLFDDGYLLMSTSPRLSKQILNGSLKKADSIETRLNGIDNPVAFGRIPGRTIGNFFRSLVEWVAAIGRQSNARDDQVEPMRLIGGAIGEFCELIESVNWDASQVAGVRTTSLSIRIAGEREK